MKQAILQKKKKKNTFHLLAWVFKIILYIYYIFLY